MLYLPGDAPDGTDMTSPKNEEARRQWLAELSHWKLIDDDLPFDLFQDVRALAIVFVPGEWGNRTRQVFARFYTGAHILLTEQEERQVFAALQWNEQSLTDYGWSSFFPSSAHIRTEKISNLLGTKFGRNIEITLLYKEDIEVLKAYRERTHPRQPEMAIRIGELVSSFWKLLDTGKLPKKDLDALEEQRSIVRSAVGRDEDYHSAYSKQRLAEERARLAEMEA